MKTMNREQFRRLRLALSSAYGHREIAVSNAKQDWPAQVMRRIRTLETPDYQSLYLMLFEKLLWKFSPVALTVVLLLALAFVQIGLNAGHETAHILAQDPVDFGLYAFYAK